MNQETQGKLAVSRDVVEQLNAMARNSAAPANYAQDPRSPGPPPTPNNSSVDFED
jgi:hypothetical protein